MSTPDRPSAELPADLIRRVLVATGFDYTGELFWRHDNGVLSLYADCSDVFAWACADCEPIETEADVALLEQCLRDLQAATGETYPRWLTELYAARRRRRQVAGFLMDPGSRHYVGDATGLLFEDVREGAAG